MLSYDCSSVHVDTVLDVCCYCCLIITISSEWSTAILSIGLLVRLSVIDLLNIGALNCQGLESKIDYPEICKTISSCDIFGTSETWLGEENKGNIKIPNYEFFPLDRVKDKRGGLGVFIKYELIPCVKIRKDLSCENFLWCQLKKQYFGYRDDVYIGMVYFPPETSDREKRLNVDHFKHHEETTRKINSDNISLMGDFNART